MKRMLHTVNAPPPSGPYSQGVMAGDFIFVSGQDGLRPDGEADGDTVAAQAARCLENIKNILAEADASIDDIVYVTCHLSDLNENTMREFNNVYEKFFEDVAVKPARITVGSQLLGLKAEISAIAYVK